MVSLFVELERAVPVPGTLHSKPADPWEGVRDNP